MKLRYLAITLVLICTVSAQEKETCHHESSIERFENVRVYPVKITFFDGLNVSYVMIDKVSQKAGDLKISPYSNVPKDLIEKLKHDKHYSAWVVFCEMHRTIYSIFPIDEK